MKNLPSIQKNRKIALQKTKKLIGIGNKILARKGDALSDDGWMERLWEWADENNILDYGRVEAYMRRSSYSSNEDYMPGWGWIDNKTFRDGGYARGFPRDREYLLNTSGLDLRESSLTELPKEIGNLTNLTGLCLAGCNLTELPKEIGNLINLTGLYLEKNNLTELPKEIVNLTNLTEFNLKQNPNLILTHEQEKWIIDLEENGCDISIDDDWVERLWEWADENYIPDLEWIEDEHLDYGGCWEGLPRDREKLLSLTVLVLNDNNLTELPKEIGNLKNLTTLVLFNNLTELPKEIGNLTDLTALFLSYNNLIELPNEIGNLTNLTQLELKENPNLILNQEQKEWINYLVDNGCNVFMDDDLFNRVIEIDESLIPF